MQDPQPTLLTRSDTFFGVCEGLGEDLRIPANLLRLAFAGLLFFNPLIALGAYAGAGALVALTRWAYPSPGAEPAEPAARQQPLEAQAPADPEPQSLAA